MEQFIIGIPEKPDSCRLCCCLSYWLPPRAAERFFLGGKMPTFPPMIYVDYISRFFNLFFSLSSESCLERWILDCFVCLFPPNPPPLQRKKRPTKRRKRQWLMVRFTLLAVVKVTIFDKCNFYGYTTGFTVFENHITSLIQQCERSELRLHFVWDKSSLKYAKNGPFWRVFRKYEACS